ncbi:MAG: hypothetical protein HY870_19635, partial [Chloroflexi bacterium]|nr:hypothetical protein [Chloroflexota bacterium]
GEQQWLVHNECDGDVHLGGKSAAPEIQAKAADEWAALGLNDSTWANEFTRRGKGPDYLRAYSQQAAEALKETNPKAFAELKPDDIDNYFINRIKESDIEDQLGKFLGETQPHVQRVQYLLDVNGLPGDPGRAFHDAGKLDLETALVLSQPGTFTPMEKKLKELLHSGVEQHHTDWSPKTLDENKLKAAAIDQVDAWFYARNYDLTKSAPRSLDNLSGWLKTTYDEGNLAQKSALDWAIGQFKTTDFSRASSFSEEFMKAPWVANLPTSPP